MTWYRVCMACAVGVALAACKYEQGIQQPLAPLAGLRYVNVVNDTGAVDFRIVNFVGDAPNAGQADFRTGGMPYGVSTSFLPPHFPVEAGREVQIRVFMNGTEPSIASLVVFDTTCTFTAGVNYTFFLYGSARGAAVHARVTVDTIPTALDTNRVAFRVLHLGGTAVGNVDVDIVPQATVAPLPGTAKFANVAPGALTAYDTAYVNAALKAVTSAPASRTPIVLTANAPAGVVGTTTVNPVAGTLVRRTAITAVIVPRPVLASKAQTGCSSVPAACVASDTLPRVLFMIDRKPSLTAP